MFCNDCGTENPVGSHFCAKCGQDLSGKLGQHDVNVEATPVQTTGDVSEFYEMAIGPKNTEFYNSRFRQFDSQGAGISWNWPAFFVSFFWLLHRKMWGWAALYFIFPYLLGAVIGVIFGGSEAAVGLSYLLYFVAVFVIFPMYANSFYYKHLRKKIGEAIQSTTDSERAKLVIADKGGTSGLVLVFVFILVFVATVGILAAIALPAYQDYTVRAKMAEPLALLAEAKTAVTKYFVANGEMPVNASAAGIRTSPNTDIVKFLSIDSSNGGVLLTITMQSDIVPGNTTAYFELSGSRLNGTIIWKCKKGNMQPKYLPANCRSE